MARSTLTITYAGTNTRDFALDVTLGPKQFIRQVFSPGESLDVSNICTADELNRHAGFAALLAAGTFTLAYAGGTDDIPSTSVSAMAAEDAQLMAPLVMKRIALTSGGAAGTADDVTIYSSNCPRAYRILDAFAVLSTVEAGSSMSLRSASGGGGTLLCAAVASATAGLNRAAGTTPTALGTVAKGGSLFLRRSDRNIVGTLIVILEPL